MGSTNKTHSIESPTEHRRMLLRKGLCPPVIDNCHSKTKGVQMYLEIPSTATLIFILNKKNVP